MTKPDHVCDTPLTLLVAAQFFLRGIQIAFLIIEIKNCDQPLDPRAVVMKTVDAEVSVRFTVSVHNDGRLVRKRIPRAVLGKGRAIRAEAIPNAVAVECGSIFPKAVAYRSRTRIHTVQATKKVFVILTTENQQGFGCLRRRAWYQKQTMVSNQVISGRLVAFIGFGSLRVLQSYHIGKDGLKRIGSVQIPLSQPTCFTICDRRLM